MSRTVMWDMFHGLEPFVGVTELRHHQGVVRIERRVIELKPMFVTSQFLFDDKFVSETFREMAVCVCVCVK